MPAFLTLSTMLLFLAILLGLPSFVGVLYLLAVRTRGKKAMTADEETATAEDGPTKVNRLKKGNPIQENLPVILESEEELTIKDTNTSLLLAEDSSDSSDDEELMLHHGVFSI